MSPSVLAVPPSLPPPSFRRPFHFDAPWVPPVAPTTPKMELPVEERAKNPKFLFEAASKGIHLEVKLLIDTGADFNVKNKHGTTPLMFAVKG